MTQSSCGSNGKHYIHQWHIDFNICANADEIEEVKHPLYSLGMKIADKCVDSCSEKSICLSFLVF